MAKMFENCKKEFRYYNKFIIIVRIEFFKCLQASLCAKGPFLKTEVYRAFLKLFLKLFENYHF